MPPKHSRMIPITLLRALLLWDLTHTVRLKPIKKKARLNHRRKRNRKQRTRKKKRKRTRKQWRSLRQTLTSTRWKKLCALEWTAESPCRIRSANLWRNSSRRRSAKIFICLKDMTDSMMALMTACSIVSSTRAIAKSTATLSIELAESATKASSVIP